MRGVADLPQRQVADEQLTDGPMPSVVRYWPQWFRDSYGGRWSNYVAFDIETTYFDKAVDVITEFGHCLVQDGQVVSSASVVFDWTQGGWMRPGWIQARLARQAEQMGAAGKRQPVSLERMRAEGIDPMEAVHYVRDLLATLRERRVLFACHNGYRFDAPFINAFLQRYKAGGFEIGDNDLVDTHALERASLLLHDTKVFPRASDTLRSWSNRVNVMKLQGSYSNIEHCCQRYDFAGRFGVDYAKLHTAGEDAYCCHLLMQEHVGAHDEPPVTNGVTARQAPLPPPPPMPPPTPPASPPPAPAVRPARYRGTLNR